jgi:hypothetical protein
MTGAAKHRVPAPLGEPAAWVTYEKGRSGNEPTLLVVPSERSATDPPSRSINW